MNANKNKIMDSDDINKMNSDELKEIVKEKYGRIADRDKKQNASSCCGSTSCCSSMDYTVFSDDYKNLEGYNADADLGLGCGLPTQFAGIEPGHHVLDLGSGAGNDCFVARAIVGETGKVTGLDFTDAMIAKANVNREKLGYQNVEFIQGDIEDIPLHNGLVDVVVSNCVLNLVPDKDKAFAEIYRVLKPGGHFCVSDVVIKGRIPDKLRQDAEMYAGCVAGAIEQDEYLAIIGKTGFNQPVIHKSKQVEIPDELLTDYMTPDEITAFKNSGTGIFSITVSAYKPL